MKGQLTGGRSTFFDNYESSKFVPSGQDVSLARSKGAGDSYLKVLLVRECSAFRLRLIVVQDYLASLHKRGVDISP